jgi:uncharacterized protein (TIGR03000 family)
MSRHPLSVVLGVSALLFGAGQLRAAPNEGVPANIRVNLPADATLTFDGTPTTSTSANRWFVTPPLAEGNRYGYNLKAEFVRDGKTITVQKQIWVRPGRDTDVSLNVPGQGDAGSPDVRNFYYAPETPAAPAAAPAFYSAPETPAAPARSRYHRPERS